jgi:hypothetical protein
MAVIIRMGAARLDPTTTAAWAPQSWLTTVEAARHLKRSASAVRTLVHRGQLVPDGRGPRGTHMFRLLTLDRFIEAGVRYAPGRHAAPGERVGDEKQRQEDSVSGHSVAGQGAISRPHQVARSQDRQGKGGRSDLRGAGQSRGGQRSARGASGAARSREARESAADAREGLRALVAEFQAAHTEAVDG